MSTINSDKDLGIFGENLAIKYLKKKGYKILDKNFFFQTKNGPKLGEIDVIAKKEGKISFLEIKTLSCAGKIEPEEKVNFIKRQKIEKVAQIWLDKNDYRDDCEWQIDVISIILNSDQKTAKIVHFKNI